METNEKVVDTETTATIEIKQDETIPATDVTIEEVAKEETKKTTKKRGRKSATVAKVEVVDSDSNTEQVDEPASQKITGVKTIPDTKQTVNKSDKFFRVYSTESKADILSVQSGEYYILAESENGSMIRIAINGVIGWSDKNEM